jgi:hypothetical protein
MTLRNVAKRGALALAVVAAVLVAGNLHPQELEDLDRAKRAGEAIQDRGDRLRRNLERVTRNIGEGEGLGSTTARISRLTLKQRSSLLRVTEIVAEQYGSLLSAVGSIERAATITDSITAETTRQSERLRRTVGLLRRLRHHAITARRVSVGLANEALYGARLAEDSARAFSSR